MNSQSLITGDIVKVSSGECYFYAGFIPAQGHYVKDAFEETFLVANHEVPILVQRQAEQSSKPRRSLTPDPFYRNLREGGLWSFPNDPTY